MGEFEGIEIPDNLLEGISGGVLDDVTIGNLKALVAIFKGEGYGFDELINFLSYLKTDDAWQEMYDFMLAEFNA